MITHFYRPKSIQEALELLAEPNTVPLAGGTFINTPEFSLGRQKKGLTTTISVVDLQDLGLNHIRKHGNSLDIDACVTLQQLMESQHTPEGLKRAIKQELPLNIRNAATVAGALVASMGFSSFSTALLALDAKLLLQPGDTEIALGNFLPMRNATLPEKLIVKIMIPLNTHIAYDYVARSPSDRPIVCAAIAQWDSGRTRLTLGGFGAAPLLALDGNADDDIQAAARNGFHEAADEWASAEYRADVAATLSMRCLKALSSLQPKP